MSTVKGNIVEKSKRESETVKVVPYDDLPGEIKFYEAPLGIPQYIFIRVIFLVAHLFTAYTIFYLYPFGIIPKATLLFVVLFGYFSGFGITVGCHRYWTHKTFKANLPLQVLLMIMQTVALQFPIFKWSRDHRAHHKYMDTNSDPHSAARGFWFSHMLWLLQPKHPELVEALKEVHISDLAQDPVVRFQARYYVPIALFFGLLIPIWILQYFFPEMTYAQMFAVNMTRYVFILHDTFTVNSFAHWLGDKPYDKYITPSENRFVSLFALGEGWHNYHHTFPWDYKTSEFPYTINMSTVFIDFFAMIGWAWDMKTVSKKMLVDRINRTGNGEHPLYNKANDTNTNNDSKHTEYWGWGDENLKDEDIEITRTIFPSKSHRG